jgi:hypothetical protein
VFNSCERKFYNLCPVWSLFAAMTTIKSWHKKVNK